MKNKTITLYDSYYSTEKEEEIREFLFDVYGDEKGWKSPEDISDERVFEEMHVQDDFTWQDVKDGLSAKDRELHNTIMNNNFYSALPYFAKRIYGL